MAVWTAKKIDPSQINSGQQYADGNDYPALLDLNDAIQGVMKADENSEKALTTANGLADSIAQANAGIATAQNAATQAQLSASAAQTSALAAQKAAEQAAETGGTIVSVDGVVQPTLAFVGGNPQTQINAKLTAPGGTATQVISGTGALITPSATPASGGTVPFTTGGAYTQLALKATLASPTFTGTPRAPAPATTSNDTQIATTAFVKSQNPFKVLWDYKETAGLSTPPTITTNYALPFTLELGRHYQIHAIVGAYPTQIFDINLKSPTLPANSSYATFRGVGGTSTSIVTTTLNFTSYSQIASVVERTVSGTSGVTSTTSTTHQLLRIVEVFY